MNRPLRRTYSQITLDERRKIERWHAAKVSVDIIAEKLGRHRSTIFRELKRNRFEDPEMHQKADSEHFDLCSQFRNHFIGLLLASKKVLLNALRPIWV
jgi:IS30 family transposase